MPFQSEKQRRYLWANEPEIARDWTDTYGSRIRKDNGGIMQGGVQNFLGEQPMVNAPKYWQSAPDHEMTELAYITPKERDLLVDVDMYGTMRGGPNRGPSGIMSLNGWGSADEKQNVAGADISSGMDKDPGHKGWSTGVGANQTTQGTHGGWDTKQEHQKAQTQAFKDMGYKGAKLNRLVGGGPNIGNWASGFAGSKIGGGLGSMLFGPWGMLLGSLFGRGVGQRAYTASQTDEQETLKDILFGDNNILSSMFNKKKTPTPTSEGLGGIRSAKDYIDLDKSYSEFDTIPNTKYHGLNIGRNYMGEGIGSASIKRAGGLQDYDWSSKDNPELHQQMNDAATKAQNDYLGKIKSGEIPFPDNLAFEMSKVGDKARHDIMQSQSDAPDIFSETLQEGLDKSNIQGKQKQSREQELLKEIGI